MDLPDDFFLSAVERTLEQQEFGLKTKCLVIKRSRDFRGLSPMLFSAVTMMLKQLNFA